MGSYKYRKFVSLLHKVKFASTIKDTNPIIHGLYTPDYYTLLFRPMQTVTGQYFSKFKEYKN